jgi:hypothetical protein
MPVLTDDVVVHGDAELSGDLDDRLGHADIGHKRIRSTVLTFEARGL